MMKTKRVAGVVLVDTPLKWTFFFVFLFTIKSHQCWIFVNNHSIDLSSHFYQEQGKERTQKKDKKRETNNNPPPPPRKKKLGGHSSTPLYLRLTSVRATLSNNARSPSLFCLTPSSSACAQKCTQNNDASVDE